MLDIDIFSTNKNTEHSAQKKQNVNNLQTIERTFVDVGKENRKISLGFSSREELNIYRQCGFHRLSPSTLELWSWEPLFPAQQKIMTRAKIWAEQGKSEST